MLSHAMRHACSCAPESHSGPAGTPRHLRESAVNGSSREGMADDDAAHTERVYGMQGQKRIQRQPCSSVKISIISFLSIPNTPQQEYISCNFWPYSDTEILRTYLYHTHNCNLILPRQEYLE